MPNNIWNLIKIGIVALIILIAVVAIKELKSIAYVGSNPNMTNSITVSGSGDSVVIPDIASFSFTVRETDKTVAAAQNKASEKINSVLKAVRESGVADKDIQTASYNIDPHYEYQSLACSINYCPPSKSVLTGYDVSQTIAVKVRDLSKAGSIFTSIGSLDVSNVSGLSFSVDDPDAVQATAREKAITEAQTKATKLAKQLGVRLVRVSSFYESNGPTPTYNVGASAKVMSSVSRDEAVAPEVPVGEDKVTVSVSVTYEIE